MDARSQRRSIGTRGCSVPRRRSARISRSCRWASGPRRRSRYRGDVERPTGLSLTARIVGRPGGVNSTRKDANPSPRNIAAMTKTTRSPMYTDLALYIDGKWGNGGGRQGEDGVNSATEKTVAHPAPSSNAEL